MCGTTGFLFAGTFYASFAAIGYYFYGDCSADTVTLNLMLASPILGTIATLLVLLSTFVTISVVCVPVVRILTGAYSTAKARRSTRSKHNNRRTILLTHTHLSCPYPPFPPNTQRLYY